MTREISKKVIITFMVNTAGVSQQPIKRDSALVKVELLETNMPLPQLYADLRDQLDTMKDELSLMKDELSQERQLRRAAEDALAVHKRARHAMGSKPLRKPKIFVVGLPKAGTGGGVGKGEWEKGKGGASVREDCDPVVRAQVSNCRSLLVLKSICGKLTQ